MNDTENKTSRFDFINIVLTIIALPLYVVLWPLVPFSLLSSFQKELDFNKASKILAIFPDKIIDIFTIIFYLFFIISIIYIKKNTKQNFIKVICTSYCYAFIAAPGVIGGEGFGLPAPFPIAVFPPGFASSETLRALFVFFAYTWLLTFACSFSYYLLEHFTKKNSAKIY